MAVKEAHRVVVSWRSAVVVDGHSPMQGKIIAMGDSGFSMLIPHTLRTGVRHRVLMETPLGPGGQRQYLECQATVLHSVLTHGTEFRVGFQIDQMDGKQRDQLKNWLASRP